MDKIIEEIDKQLLTLDDNTKRKNEEFVSKAKIVHQNRETELGYYPYDYSKVIYINNKTEVIIICLVLDIIGKIHGIFRQTPNFHLTRNGCKICRDEIKNRKKQERFIAEAIAFHGNKYNYDKVIYKGAYVNVIIFCPKLGHGDFPQAPGNHLRCGCPKCSNNYRMSHDEFIEIVKKKHGDKYDYTDMAYNGIKRDIEIKCIIHGKFWINAEIHMKGSECYECSKEKLRNNFIKKAIQKHGSKYDYSKVVYINNTTNVQIYCIKGNHYTYQKPTSHLRTDGCNICYYWSIEEIIIASKRIFGDDAYDYSKLKYKYGEKIILICKKHNKEFLQMLNSHLYGNYGCPSCGSVGHSKKQIQWLEHVMKTENIHIQHALNGGEVLIGELKVDGFCEKSNTVYEFHGSFYHCSPRAFETDYRFAFNKMNKLIKKTFGELYLKTLDKNNYLHQQTYDLTLKQGTKTITFKKNYNVVIMWEEEWDKQVKAMKQITTNNKSQTESEDDVIILEDSDDEIIIESVDEISLDEIPQVKKLPYVLKE